MYKQILGISLMVLLLGILLMNMMNQNTTSESKEINNEYNVTGDTSVEGVSISPVESAGIEPGEAAPDFELETMDGEIFRLSDLKGKKVFLNFWYSYCPPCLEEMPDMQVFYEEHGEEVEIVGVNLTEIEYKEQDAFEFIDEFGYTYTIPLDRDGKVADQYKIVAAPITYFIGTDGIVQQPRKVGPMTYDFMVEMTQTLN